MKGGVRFLADLGERVGRTFVQAYGAYWVAKGPDWDHLFTVNGLEVAGAAAALALLMGLGFKPVGDPETASALPAEPPKVVANVTVEPRPPIPPPPPPPPVKPVVSDPPYVPPVMP